MNEEILTTLVGSLFGAVSAGMILGIIIFIVLATLIVYLYSAWAIYTIAVKTKTSNAWLSWIPVVQLWMYVAIPNQP